MNTITNGTDDEIIDVEEYFAAGKTVPKGKRYKIRIDKDPYIVGVPTMTGREILALAGKTPEKNLLRQKVQGGVHSVEPDQSVSFDPPGVERFMTIPKEVQEGEPPLPRMHFTPLQSDLSFLNALGLRWETIIEGSVKAIVIRQWPILDGYNVATADVHVRLTDGYPDAQIDMAYFTPMLVRSDGRNIGGLSPIQFDGQEWQQWSRHRTPSSAWRIGEDDLSTHLALVNEWLSSELRK